MIIRIIKWVLISFGGLFLILTLLCFTSIPFWSWYGLSVKNAGIHRPPEFIIVLGGGGMPSETGLMRTWYASRLADHFYKAAVIVALPGRIKDTLSSVSQMKQELVTRGIAHGRILVEDSGTNTRSQALCILNMIRKIKRLQLAGSTPGSYQANLTLEESVSKATCSTPILIVSSPEHIYRAVLAFKKTGFILTDGIPAFDNAIESDITFNDAKLGGRKWMPGMGSNITVRYRFWSQLRYEELVMRELFAITYYWLKGWI